MFVFKINPPLDRRRKFNFNTNLLRPPFKFEANIHVKAKISTQLFHRFQLIDNRKSTTKFLVFASSASPIVPRLLVGTERSPTRP